MDITQLPPKVQRAREVAIQAHGDQKYGDQPYVVHLDEVVEILIEFGYTDEITLAAGYLHDVLEDTRLTADDLVSMDPDCEVRFIVVFCTDEKGANRKERKAKTYARMRRTIDLLWLGQGTPELILRCIRVKLADRIANLRSCTRNNPGLLSMYQKETESFRMALILDVMDKDGKEIHYLKEGVADAMWLEYDRLLGVTL